MKRKLKPIGVIFTVLLAIISVITVALAISARPLPDGSTAQLRRQYITALGYRCSEQELSREIVIPAEFSEVYQNYNELQKQYGFDLSRFKGDSATVYTYSVTDYPDPSGGFYRDINLNLIVSNGKIIGGDISSAELDGFMEGLHAKN